MKVTYEEFLDKLAALPLAWEIKDGKIESNQGCPWLAVAKNEIKDVGRFNIQNGDDWRNKAIWDAADNVTDDFIRQDLLKACKLV